MLCLGAVGRFRIVLVLLPSFVSVASPPIKYALAILSFLSPVFPPLLPFFLSFLAPLTKLFDATFATVSDPSDHHQNEEQPPDDRLQIGKHGWLPTPYVLT
jgi:hypothetical protein